MTRYGLRNRPAGYAHCPPGWSDPQPHPAFRNFGTIAYPEPLSRELQDSYELTRIVSEKEGAHLVTEGIKRDGNWEYVEEVSREQPRWWLASVGKHLADAVVYADLETVAGMVAAEARKGGTP